MTTIVSDTFTAADSTTLSGRSPDVGSNTWAIAAMTSAGSPGTATIQSNKAQLETNSNVVVIESSDADVIITCDYIPQTAQDNRYGLTARFVAAGSCWLLTGREPNGDIQLYEVSGTSVTTRDSAAFTWTEGNTYALKFVTSGDDLTGYIDSTQYVTYNSASYNTATKHGLSRNTATTAATLDNFVIDDGAGGGFQAAWARNSNQIIGTMQ